MAIDNPRATTAYAANRYAPRPTTGPVGKGMSAKQRDFVATLVTQSQDYMRRMVAATEPRGAVTQDMITEALQDFSPAATVRAIQDTLNQTGRSARVVIDALIASRDALRLRCDQIESAARKREAATHSGPARDAVEDGQTYRAADGRVFHAYLTQAGRLCLKMWNADADAFEWFGSARLLPAGSVKMSRDDAAAFGQATGTCCMCMRHLTNDASVAAGIGPVCAGKF